MRRRAQIDPAALDDGLRTGTLVRVRHGAYTARPTDGPDWLVARDALLARAAAVHAARVTPHWFSHGTAALLWGLWVARVPDAVDVTTPINPHVRDEPGIRRHWTSRPGRVDEVVLRSGLPVSPLERTVLDCAATMPPGHGLVVADSALRAEADPEVLGRLLRAAAGGRGVRRAREVVGLADARAESPGETLTRYALHTSGLPRPELQVEVATRIGPRWIDLGWPERRVGIEFDGAEKYGDDARTVRAAVLAEKRRQEALEEEGWRLLRVTWPDLARPEDIGARATRILREHAPR